MLKMLFAMCALSFPALSSCATGSKLAEFGDPKVDLIKVSEAEYGVVFDIRYATKNNFTGKQIYARPFVYAHKDVAHRLKLAASRAMQLGYKIKIFDSWRPYEGQVALWNAVPNPDYVSNPDTGPCGHCRGAAFDVTLVDAKTGKELDMGTPFDSFDEKSHHDTQNVSKEVLLNRVMLAGIMNSAGLVSIRTEWWHYQLPNFTSLYPKYKAADLGEDLVLPSRK